MSGAKVDTESFGQSQDDPQVRKLGEKSVG